MSYTDTIIQPNTSNELVAAFRAYYGLPASFQVFEYHSPEYAHYQQKNTSMAGSGPVDEQRPLVFDPAISIVSIGFSGSHDRPT